MILLTGKNEADPPNEPMMTLKNTVKILTDVAPWQHETLTCDEYSSPRGMRLGH
jgi:hypothetical protein